MFSYCSRWVAANCWLFITSHCRGISWRPLLAEKPIFVGPAVPCLVVIITTPAAAREP